MHAWNSHTHMSDQGRTGKFEGPVRNNRLGPSGLVQDREYQAIAAGKRDKRDVLCESINVRSHTCDWQLNHHKRSNNYFFCSGIISFIAGTIVIV